LEAEQARLAYIAELSLKDIKGNNLTIALEAYDAASNTVKAADDAASAFDSWSSGIASASNALNGVLGKVNAIFSAVRSVGFETIGIEAETAALKAGKSTAVASIEGEYASGMAASRANQEQGIVGTLMGVTERLGLQAKRDAQLERAKAQAAQKEFTSKDSKGGGGSKEDPASKALESYRQLVATYDEVEAKTLKVEAARKTLTEAERLGVITSQQSDEALKEYIKSLGDAKNPMLDLANTASQALSSAFMSIVDGSKSAADAFGDMARTIIKQAFEMAVINPIINSIFGGVKGFSLLPSFFADGGVFSGGGQVKAYASGGVVGGPTYFPMSGGKTGLMGEAGPEAIMPLKRGKDGKLGVATDGGGSQTVVVNQSFNFQANGDESVKKIIAQAAPSISAMAQKGMMDQRRRGGSMKSTFG